jgi:hypothetical protein
MSLWHGACLWMDEPADMGAQNIVSANARNKCHELHTRGDPPAWEFCVWVTAFKHKMLCGSKLLQTLVEDHIQRWVFVAV